MNASVMFLDCPEYVDDHGTVRCGLPAAVEYRYLAESASGPVESAKIRCPRGHGFNGPVESLSGQQPASANSPESAQLDTPRAGRRAARAATPSIG